MLTITGPKIHTESDILDNMALVIENGKIKNIESIRQRKNEGFIDKVLTFPSSWHLIPGMIDLHVHGISNFDVMDGEVTTLTNISRALLKEGVTSFVPTLIPASNSEMEVAIKNIVDFVKNGPQIAKANVVGINLEGPFLSPHKCGALTKGSLQNPNIMLFNNWQEKAQGLIKLITIAPELPDALAFIKHLHKQNVVASIGHTNATYFETKFAIDMGATHVTHLFNAMTPINHREPGAVMALLLDDRVNVELIADNVHVHPAMYEMVYKLKESKKIVLVSDAMRAKNMPDGKYMLGKNKTIVKNGVAKLTDGKLAGSTLRLDVAMQNFYKAVKCDLNDVIKMTTTNPARILGLAEHKGSIAIGKDADLVILDEDLNVKLTLVDGVVG